MKTCAKCGQNRTLEAFELRKDTGKYRGDCKSCRSRYFTNRYKENADRERKKRKIHYSRNKKSYKRRAAKWKRENRESSRKLNKRSYWRDIERTRELNRKSSARYRKNSPEKVKKNKKKYNDNRKITIQEKIASNLRARLRIAIKNNYKSSSAVKSLGCSVNELKMYLESKFQPGMTWKNYGRKGWHIDHIRPLASFNLTDPEELKKACHYTNLQPLWAKDNLSKGAKLLNSEEINYA